MGGESGEGPAPMNGLAEMIHTPESTRAMLRVAEQALLGKSKCVDKFEEHWNKPAQGQHPELNRNGFSQALVWTTEPEWQGELSEADSEIAAGSREPEGHSD
jgi:hypothetical protein